MENNLNEEKVIQLIEKTLKTSFRSKRVGDIPTDALQLTNRKYVDSYGTTANRPTAKIPAQKYFDTTINRPIYFNPNSSVWTDGAGSVS